MRDCPDIAPLTTAGSPNRRAPSVLVVTGAMSLILLAAALAALVFVPPADANGRPAPSTLHRDAVAAPAVHQVRVATRGVDVAVGPSFSALRLIVASLVIGLAVLARPRVRRWRYGGVGRRAPPLPAAV